VGQGRRAEVKVLNSSKSLTTLQPLSFLLSLDSRESVFGPCEPAPETSKCILYDIIKIVELQIVAWPVSEEL